MLFACIIELFANFQLANNSIMYSGLFNLLLRYRHTYYRFDCNTFLRIFCRLVDLIEGIEGDQAIKWELPLSIQFDQAGDKDFGDAISLDKTILAQPDTLLSRHSLLN